MTNETVDRDVFQAMWRGLYEAGDGAVYQAGGEAMNGVVYWGVHWAIHGAVYDAVDGDVYWGVDETGAHHEAQPHPRLGIYLGGVPG